MKNSYTFIVVITVSALLMGGCWNMGKSKEEPDNTNTDQSSKEDNDSMTSYERENYVPIQEYTGEGFTLRDANPKTGEIAEEHRDKVIEAVEGFFLDNYKTEVEVHNIVSAVDGVSVFVESIGEPHFYSFAIVPIDIKNEEVMTDQVWSQEGQVEGAINSGLFAMAFEEEFLLLNDLLSEIEERYPVVGMNIEVAENTQGNGYNTPYYFVTTGLRSLMDMYIENPDITKEELRLFLDEERYDYSKTNEIPIRFYMEEAGVDLDEKLYDEIFEEIKNLEGIPGGRYSFMLNDNFIDRRRAIGEKDNTIDKTQVERIIKK